MKKQRYRIFISAVALAAATLAGCATQGGGDSSSLLVTPGRYDFYSCPQMAQATVPLRVREKELEALMAKAGDGPGGALASTLAYRSDYLQVRGNLNELAKSAAAKNCPPVQPPMAEPAPSPPSSKPKPKAKRQ